jgi:glutaconate CoA-transferase subunit A
MVAAVVHEPWGAHPSPVQGYYGRDHAFFEEYHTQSRTVEGFGEWLGRWVMGVTDRHAYAEQLTLSRRTPLAVREHAYSAAADFGF